MVDVLHRIEQEPYHHPIGRVTFQKIAYFATRLRIPTGIEFRKGSYGPYSPTLKAVETKLVNNGLIKEERLERMLRARVGPTYQDARKVYPDELLATPSSTFSVSTIGVLHRHANHASSAQCSPIGSPRRDTRGDSIQRLFPLPGRPDGMSGRLPPSLRAPERPDGSAWARGRSASLVVADDKSRTLVAEDRACTLSQSPAPNNHDAAPSGLKLLRAS